MIHTLDSISLADFIEVISGNISLAGDNSESEGAKIKASEHLVMDYLEIVGGAGMMVEMAKKNRELNNLMRIQCMENCEDILKRNEWKNVSEALSVLGYNIPSEDREKITQRIASIKSTALLEIQMSGPQKEAPKMDKNYFIKERVMIMSHNKMHIDPKVFKAKEYAYLVKMMGEEVKSMMKRGKN